MIRQLLGGLSALVVVGVLVSGCQSTPEEVVEESDPPTPIVQQTKPPAEVEPPPPFDEQGRPIHPIDRTPIDTVFYFEYDQARLSRADIGVLAVHAQILRDYRNYSVQVEGHCDERGSREYNLALGERRSMAVRRYLISAGVRSTQIETVSYGEERPVDPGHDESAWAKNRRAEMTYRR